MIRFSSLSIISFVLMCSLAMGQHTSTDSANTPALDDELLLKVQALSEKLKSKELAESENFAKDLLKFRQTATNYLAKLEAYCRRGVKKTITEPKKKRIRMDRAEKKACFAKLKQAYGDIIQKVYFAQKKYLQRTHSKELEKLGDLRKESLIDLEKAYQRYLK